MGLIFYFKTLLIENLQDFDVIKKSLNLSLTNLKNRKQRVCLNNTFNEWINILLYVLRGSILGSLLFNIYFMVSILVRPLYSQNKLSGRELFILYWFKNFKCFK